MNLSNLTLRNFRNYEKADLEFEHGIHLITGKNAQGKTNLLEAIAYLSTTRSHRTNDDQDMIQEGKDAFVLRASIHKHMKQVELRAAVNEQGKNLFLYRTPIKRVSNFIGELNAVLFCPDDMSLFQASPKVRRRFIDMELSKLSKSYTRMLNEAHKLLKERNACLKQDTIDPTYLEVLTQQLIEKQIVIIRQRHRFLIDLLENCHTFYKDLSNDDTNLAFCYHSCVEYSENEMELKQRLIKKYEKNKERDLFLKQTTTGFHKEDFMFLINDKEVSSYASQGQKRSVLLSMKIGMVSMIASLIHEYPVLLLDDVFSELDEYRKQKLLIALPKDVQIFITTTDVNEIPIIEDRRYILWNVNHGCITRGTAEGGCNKWRKM
ncbi:MAG: DNA replication/repair protein RecF [Erysipelotrichaceae bacterium]|nr:DNA replication/repair protein RecF [Erysipelotrichaceae bacterium]